MHNPVMWHDPTGLFAVPSIVIISQLTNPILAPGGIFNLLPNLRPTLVLAGLGNSDKNEILDAGGGPGSGGFTGKIKSSNNTITTPVAPKPPAVTARHNALDAGRGAVGNVVQRVQVTAPPATSSVAVRHNTSAYINYWEHNVRYPRLGFNVDPPRTFNSNSFTHGLLLATGVPIPIPTRRLPGWDSPLPSHFFSGYHFNYWWA